MNNPYVIESYFLRLASDLGGPYTLTVRHQELEGQADDRPHLAAPVGCFLNIQDSVERHNTADLKEHLKEQSDMWMPGGEVRYDDKRRY